MTIQVEHTGRKADIAPTPSAGLRTLAQIREQRPPLPSPSDEQAWTAGLVADIAHGRTSGLIEVQAWPCCGQMVGEVHNCAETWVAA